MKIIDLGQSTVTIAEQYDVRVIQLIKLSAKWLISLCDSDDIT
jgi:hypothetical protein